jgi:hypothetical protein
MRQPDPVESDILFEATNIVFARMTISSDPGTALVFAAGDVTERDVLAQAFQKWGLHRRVALLILATIATRPRQIQLGSMLATAGMSRWVSNTPTALMILPIEAAVIARMGVEA